AAAMNRPELAGDAALGPGVVGRLEVIVEPDEVERCADPGDAGDHMDCPAQQVEPVHRVTGDQDWCAVIIVRAWACASRSCSSCAATPTAIAAASLLPIPTIPIGIVRRATSPAPKPRCSSRWRKRAVFGNEPIT